MAIADPRKDSYQYLLGWWTETFLPQSETHGLILETPSLPVSYQHQFMIQREGIRASVLVQEPIGDYRPRNQLFCRMTVDELEPPRLRLVVRRPERRYRYDDFREGVWLPKTDLIPVLETFLTPLPVLEFLPPPSLEAVMEGMVPYAPISLEVQSSGQSSAEEQG